MAGGSGIELATAYVTIIPSLKGASKSIASQLGSVDVSKAGASLGKSLGKSMSDGLGDAALDSMAKQVERAERNVASASKRTADAQKVVSAATRELVRAREEHGSASSQAAKAEANLNNALSRLLSATKNSDAQVRALAEAQDRLKRATAEAERQAAIEASTLGRLSTAAGNAAAKLGSVGSKLSGAGSSLWGVGTTLTAGVTAPLVAATAAAGGFALSTASAAEQSEISFTTMLGSEEAALDMMGQLSDFAAKTPFELSGLQTATQQLLAYGFEAEQVIPMLTAVGDATSALGTGQQGIEAVTRALGQMQARGKVSAEEMLQLTEAGVPAWEYLARAIGTDTAGAMDAVSRGAVDATTGIQALTAGMEQDFGGMMEAQATTVTGLMSNLSDAIQRPLMELRNTDAYERLSEALGNLVDSAGPFVESLLPHMENGLDLVSGALDKAAGAMDAFAGMSEEEQGRIIGIATAAAGAGPALTVLGGGLRVAGGAMEGASKVFGKGSDVLGKMAGSSGVVGKLTSALGGLKGGLVGLGVTAAVAGIALLADKFAEAAEKEKLLSDATMTLGEISEEAAGKLGQMSMTGEEHLQAMADLNQQAVDTLGELSVQSSLLDSAMSVIEQYAGQTGLTATEQAKLTQAVEDYNSVTGGSVEVIDAANGVLSASTDELQDNAQAWRDNAAAQAYSEMATEYAKEQIAAEQDLTAAREEYNEALEAYYGLLETSPQAAQAMAAEGGDLYEAEQNLWACAEAADAASANVEGMSTSAMIAGAAIDTSLKNAVLGLPTELQSAGFTAAQSLAMGVQNGSITLDVASQAMTDLISSKVLALPAESQAAGMAAASYLAQEIANGSIGVGQAAAILDAAATGDISSLPPELQGYGQNAMNLFSGAIGAGATATGENVALVTDEVRKLNDEAANSATWGRDLIENFAAGISGAAELVTTAGNTVMGALTSLMQFSVPEDGPWSGAEKGGFTSGMHLVENFAAGMRAAVPDVESAAIDAANAAAFRTTWGYSRNDRQSQQADMLATLIKELPMIIRDNVPSEMTVEGRAFARAVKRVVPT